MKRYVIVRAFEGGRPLRFPDGLSVPASDISTAFSRAAKELKPHMRRGPTEVSITLRKA